MSALALFTEEQQDAVTRRAGSLALAANAGSGKTSVLVERFVAAVLEDGVEPRRILAITFTDRAAGELRERIAGAFLERGERALARESGRAFISTFHAFAARVLRAHVLLAGVAPGFSVLEEADAELLRARAFDDALERWLGEDPRAVDLTAAFTLEGLRRAIGAVHDELRSRGETRPTLPALAPRDERASAHEQFMRACAACAAELGSERSGGVRHARAMALLERAAAISLADANPAALEQLCLGRGSRALQSAACEAFEVARVRYRQALADRLALDACALLGELLARYGERALELKRERGALDFDDLELATRDLLWRHAPVAAAWRERFELLMVDELQDTNARQMAILAALDRDNLFTVGDEFQSIYGFRHADVSLFRERRSALAARERAPVLSANFRARGELIAAINSIFAPRFGDAFVPLRAGRAARAGVPEHRERRIELLLTLRENRERSTGAAARALEASLLAQRIAELVRSGTASAGEIVVLVRAATHIGTYEAAIAEQGLASASEAGAGFYERPEIGDLREYVSLLANPLDERALFAALASPLCGCSSDTLVRIALRARELGCSPWHALGGSLDWLDGEAGRVERFAATVVSARERAQRGSLAALLGDALREHDYERHLSSLADGERRLANVAKLIRLAAAYERREGRDLRRFADRLAAGMLGARREAQAPVSGAGNDPRAVRLMTIHAAKGLEFPVVAVADLDGWPRPQLPALIVDGARLGVRLPTLEGVSVEALDYSELAGRRLAVEAAEERRILYVALTRARERLLLSGVVDPAKWRAPDPPPIAWLGAPLVEDLAPLLAGGESDSVPATPTVLVHLRSLARAATPSGANGTAADALCVATKAPLRVVNGAAGAPASPAPPLGRRRPRASTIELPAALSYTAIAEYERCRYRFQLQRIAGLADVAAPAAPELSDGDPHASARGVAVHALLEALDFADPRAPSAAQIELAARAAGLADGGRGVLGELVASFARSSLCRRLADATAVRRELAFTLVLEDGRQLLRGVLDVAARERDGTLLIVDYKTDAVGAEEEEDLEARMRRDYALQRELYALAGLAEGATAVEVVHCFLRRAEQPLSVRFGAAERASLEALIAARLAPMRAGRFEPSSQPHRALCATCPGRARLCFHEPALTLRDAII